MNNIVLDIYIDRELRENDVIAYRNGKWRVVTQSSYLSNSENKQKMKNYQYERRIAKLEQDLLKLAKIVKEK